MRFERAPALPLTCVGRQVWPLLCGLVAAVAAVAAQPAPPAGAPVVALELVLAEVEQAFAAQRPAEAVAPLDQVLQRIAAGEPLPGGVTRTRLRLAAATAHFQADRPDTAAQHAEAVLAETGSATEQAEARLVLGLALARLERFAEAVPVFAALETSPEHRDAARRYRAQAAHAAGDLPTAVAAYESYLTAAPRDAAWAEAALALVALDLERNEWQRASRGLDRLREHDDLLDNLAGLDVLSLRLGDALLDANEVEAALAAYDLVNPRADLVTLQSQRSDRLERELERIRTHPPALPALAEQARRLPARLEAARAALASIENDVGYDAAVLHRRARAYLQADRPWEAALTLERLLAEHPEQANRPTAFHGLVRAYAESTRPARAVAAVERFRAAEGPSELLADATGIAAAALAGAGDVDGQIRLLEALLDGFDGAPSGEPLYLQLANARFSAAQYEAVRTLAVEYAMRFPDGRVAEPMDYLHVLAGFVSGGTGRAVGELEAFLNRYPAGPFVADARYRLAMARFATEDQDGAAAACAAWLAEFPEAHPQRGEVLVLAADVAAARDRPDEAIASYRAALARPLTDELLGYTLDELTALLGRLGRGDEAAATWEAFARDRPDHPFVVQAAYWIARLRAREQRTAEALPHIAAIARRFLADPRHDGVERLLLELPALVVRATREREPERERPGQEPDRSAAGEFTVLAAAIAELLLPETENPGPTARARVRFAQAELAARLRQPEQQTRELDALLAEFAPEVLPAGLLGRLGDHAAESGRVELARSLYARIVEHHAASEFADFGYAGLGALELQAGRPAEALRWFEWAVDRAGARAKLREVTLGRGRALLELGRWEEARDVFQTVAANRQWRGACTAESVFALGEILYRKGGDGNLAQAQAHFQRVYLTYRKFVPWAVRAYVRSADTFEQLGQRREAIATLRELLRDPELAGAPEAATAAAQLALLESADGGDA